jgi:hypothetical protein
MKKEDYVFDNSLMVLAATNKKNGNLVGTNAILSLLQDLLSFKEKVESTADAQENPEAKAKVEEYNERLNEMYNALLELAKGGIKTIRQRQDTGDDILMHSDTIERLP